MGILELLTIVFVVLKLCGVIGWSWWLVLLPEIISIAGFIAWLTFVGGVVGGTLKGGKRKK
jgi:hypothetical protein